MNKGKEFFGQGTPIVNFTDVFHNRGILSENLNGKVQLEANEIKNFEVKKGDIFFTRTSESIEEIGYPSVMLDTPTNTVFSGFVLRGRSITDDDPLDDLFKKYVFFTETFRAEMLKKSSMTTRALTSGTAIKGMVFSHPTSKKEQHKIGDYITNLDNLITLHQRKYISLKLIFITWEQRKVSAITTSYSGGTPKAGTSEYYEGDIPFIRSGEIYSDKTELFITKVGMDNSSAKMVHKGDILYALYGATSGEVNRSKIEGAINQAILAIIPNNNVNADFLVEWFRKEKNKIIDKYLQGGQGNLSAQIIKELEVDIPSLNEQNAIGSYFMCLNNLITLHRRAQSHIT